MNNSLLCSTAGCWGKIYHITNDKHFSVANWYIFLIALLGECLKLHTRVAGEEYMENTKQNGD
jgi:hypothetical protein